MSSFLFMTCLVGSLIASVFGEVLFSMGFLLAGSIFYLAYVIEKK